MMRNYGIVIATLLFSFSATATTYRTDSLGTTRDDKGNSWRTDSFGTTRGSNGSVSRTDSFGTTRVTNANGENTTYRIHLVPLEEAMGRYHALIALVLRE